MSKRSSKFYTGSSHYIPALTGILDSLPKNIVKRYIMPDGSLAMLQSGRNRQIYIDGKGCGNYLATYRNKYDYELNSTAWDTFEYYAINDTVGEEEYSRVFLIVDGISDYFNIYSDDSVVMQGLHNVNYDHVYDKTYSFAPSGDPGGVGDIRIYQKIGHLYYDVVADIMEMNSGKKLFSFILYSETADQYRELKTLTDISSQYTLNSYREINRKELIEFNCKRKIAKVSETLELWTIPNNVVLFTDATPHEIIGTYQKTVRELWIDSGGNEIEVISKTDYEENLYLDENGGEVISENPYETAAHPDDVIKTGEIIGNIFLSSLVNTVTVKPFFTFSKK